MSIQNRYKYVILGGGFSGLGAGYDSDIPVFEASNHPGGICRSYYVQATGCDTESSDKFRFEKGGGHWIFDKNPEVLNIFNQHASLQTYTKKSSVFFCQSDLKIPAPVQFHVEMFPKSISDKIRSEVENLPQKEQSMEDITFDKWLLSKFGKTLCELFFFPFNDRYTSGYYTSIAPQDLYKTSGRVLRSPSDNNTSYNQKFFYPEGGLDLLSDKLSSHCRMHYGHCADLIDMDSGEIRFTNGAAVGYEKLISTLPLNIMNQLTGFSESGNEPYTSVMVINAAVQKGVKYPDDHWIYCPDSRSGFHRIGFYSNVSDSFVPKDRSDGTASIYIEHAFRGGEMPSSDQIERLTKNTLNELKEWEYVSTVESMDVNWIPIAYTWSRPGLNRTGKSIERLSSSGIYQVGRFACWKFQGLGKSFMDGMQMRKNLEALK